MRRGTEPPHTNPNPSPSPSPFVFAPGPRRLPGRLAGLPPARGPGFAGLDSFAWWSPLRFGVVQRNHVARFVGGWCGFGGNTRNSFPLFGVRTSPAGCLLKLKAPHLVDAERETTRGRQTRHNPFQGVLWFASAQYNSECASGALAPRMFKAAPRNYP